MGSRFQPYDVSPLSPGGGVDTYSPGGGGYPFRYSTDPHGDVGRQALHNMLNVPAPGSLGSLLNTLGRIGAFGVPGRVPRVPYRGYGNWGRFGQFAGTGKAAALLFGDDLGIEPMPAPGVTPAADEAWGLTRAGYTNFRFLMGGRNRACGGLGGFVPRSSGTIYVENSCLLPAAGSTATFAAAAATPTGLGIGNHVVEWWSRTVSFGSYKSVWVRHSAGVPVATKAVAVIPVGRSTPPLPQVTSKSYPSPAPSAKTTTEFGFPPPPGKPYKVMVDHKPVPPPPGVREEKFKLGKGGVIGDLFGVLTELDDFANCMAATTWAWKQYGRERKRVQPCKGLVGVAKARCLAQYADYSDPHALAELIKCVALNQVQDLVIGKLNKAANSAYVTAQIRSGGKPARGVGIERGPAYGTPTPLQSF